MSANYTLHHYCGTGYYSLAHLCVTPKRFTALIDCLSVRRPVCPCIKVLLANINRTRKGFIVTDDTLRFKKRLSFKWDINRFRFAYSFHIYVSPNGNMNEKNCSFHMWTNQFMSLMLQKTNFSPVGLHGEHFVGQDSLFELP